MQPHRFSRFHRVSARYSGIGLSYLLEEGDGTEQSVEISLNLGGNTDSLIRPKLTTVGLGLFLYPESDIF